MSISAASSAVASASLANGASLLVLRKALDSQKQSGEQLVAVAASASGDSTQLSDAAQQLYESSLGDDSTGE